MADCERGLGRPERAMAMAGEPEVQKLDKAGQVEMRLVAAGARRDMGQLDAAIVTLQSPELASSSVQPWTARLRYAYADALLAAGREDEAREWFAKALEADKDGATDASDRLAELDGVEFVDALDDESRTTRTRRRGARSSRPCERRRDDDVDEDDDGRATTTRTTSRRSVEATRTRHGDAEEGRHPVPGAALFVCARLGGSVQRPGCAGPGPSPASGRRTSTCGAW